MTAAARADSGPDRFHEYELVREIGRGAMGTIHLARDTLLDRDVALGSLLSLAHLLFVNAVTISKLPPRPTVVAQIVWSTAGLVAVASCVTTEAVTPRSTEK